MPHIAIISSSIRKDRRSHRVALFFSNYIESQSLASVEILDLQSLNFPLFDQQLSLQQSPVPNVLMFSEKIKQADGIIIVVPEYNGGYPASLKNAVDLLANEWYRKPVAISTVSNGVFGGSQVITSLQFSLWKMQAWTVPAMFPVIKVQDSFDNEGIPADKDNAFRRADKFVNELLWCIEAGKRMKD